MISAFQYLQFSSLPTTSSYTNVSTLSEENHTVFICIPEPPDPFEYTCSGRECIASAQLQPSVLTLCPARDYSPFRPSICKTELILVLLVVLSTVFCYALKIAYLFMSLLCVRSHTLSKRSVLLRQPSKFHCFRDGNIFTDQYGLYLDI